MIIKYKDHIITNLSDWENVVFSGKKKIHWKEGRSAYSLADFIINQHGVVQIENILSPIIPEPFVFDKAFPEFEARFDKYGRGREHDLAIWGTTKTGKKLFIGVEAKVDESFGDTIAFAYQKATAKLNRGENTNAHKRIEELLQFNFDKTAKEDHQLRYQLLFSTAGTLCIDADIHIMLILVFKTDDYDKDKGAMNYNDLVSFLKTADANKIDKNTYQLNKVNKKLTLIYKEIDMK